MLLSNREYHFVQRCAGQSHIIAVARVYGSDRMGFADYESLGIPSFSINSYSVGRLTPSSRAAEVIFPR